MVIVGDYDDDDAGLLTIASAPRQTSTSEAEHRLIFNHFNAVRRTTFDSHLKGKEEEEEEEEEEEQALTYSLINMADPKSIMSPVATNLNPPKNDPISLADLAKSDGKPASIFLRPPDLCLYIYYCRSFR